VVPGTGTERDCYRGQRRPAHLRGSGLTPFQGNNNGGD